MIRGWVVLIGVFTFLPAIQAQDLDRDRFLEWSYRDASRLVRALDGPDLLYGALFTAALVPISFADEPVTDFARSNRTPVTDAFFDFANPFGGKWAAPVALGLFGASLLTDDATFQDAAFTSVQAVAYTGLVTYALKGLIGRSRPHQERGAFVFEPFNGPNLSFPSGHTSAVFALVTPWVQYYGGPTYLLYVLAAGTGAARVVGHHHWLTDVLAGGMLGFVMARALSRLHQDAQAELQPDDERLIVPNLPVVTFRFQL